MRPSPLQPFPHFTTERLFLRKVTAADADAMLTLRSDAVVNRYIDRPATNTVEDALEVIHHIEEGLQKANWGYWAITLKNDDRLIGTICLWNLVLDKGEGEIGYELLPAFHGQGIMREAVQTIINFALDQLCLNKLFAWTEAGNLASVHLLERVGFQRDGAEEIAYGNREGIGNMVIYALRKSR